MNKASKIDSNLQKKPWGYKSTSGAFFAPAAGRELDEAASDSAAEISNTIFQAEAR